MIPIRLYPNEEIKEIIIEDKLRLRYVISNRGRLISLFKDMKFGRELKGGTAEGYKTFSYKIFNKGKITSKHLFFSKLIAEFFIPKTSEDQIYVLKLDRKRDNDNCRNLKRATRKKMLEFGRQSPLVIEAKKKLIEHNFNSNDRKLTVTKVMLIKKLLEKPEQRTRLKIIAKQFGVSEMQIRRIKSGEN